MARQTNAQGPFTASGRLVPALDVTRLYDRIEFFQRLLTRSSLLDATQYKFVALPCTGTEDGTMELRIIASPFRKKILLTTRRRIDSRKSAVQHVFASFSSIASAE